MTGPLFGTVLQEDFFVTQAGFLDAPEFIAAGSTHQNWSGQPQDTISLRARTTLS
jgi:hypothetical protein